MNWTIVDTVNPNVEDVDLFRRWGVDESVAVKSEMGSPLLLVTAVDESVVKGFVEKESVEEIEEDEGENVS